MVQPDSLLTLSHLEAAISVPWHRSQQFRESSAGRGRYFDFLVSAFRLRNVLLPSASMTLLNWIENETVVNHHHNFPFHLHKAVSELATGDPVGDNLICGATFLDERGLTMNFSTTTLAALKIQTNQK